MRLIEAASKALLARFLQQAAPHGDIVLRPAEETVVLAMQARGDIGGHPGAFDQQRALRARNSAARKFHQFVEIDGTVFASRRHIGRQRRGETPGRDTLDFV